MVVIHVSMTYWTKWRSYRNFRRSWFTIFYWWILSLRGRRLKGKGKGALWKGVLGAREREGRARKEGGLAWSRALIPFPFPFERLPRRLVNSACACIQVQQEKGTFQRLEIYRNMAPLNYDSKKGSVISQH